MLKYSIYAELREFCNSAFVEIQHTMLKTDSPKHDSPCPCDHHQRTRAMNPPTSYYVGVRLFESIDFASKYENKVRNDRLTPITICQETLRR